MKNTVLGRAWSATISACGVLGGSRYTAWLRKVNAPPPCLFREVSTRTGRISLLRVRRERTRGQRAHGARTSVSGLLILRERVLGRSYPIEPGRWLLPTHSRATLLRSFRSPLSPSTFCFCSTCFLCLPQRRPNGSSTKPSPCRLRCRRASPKNCGGVLPLPRRA